MSISFYNCCFCVILLQSFINQYDSYLEIADLIKDFASKNKDWFYRYIKTYSIYEYRYGFFNDNKDNKEKAFYRVYYYKGMNANLYPKMTYSAKLKKDYFEKKKNKNTK